MIKKPATNQHLPSPLTWVWQELRPYRGALGGTAFLLLLSALMVLGLIRVLKEVMSSPEDFSFMAIVLGLWAWFVTLSSITYARYRLSSYIVTHIINTWRERLLTEGLKKPFWSWIERPTHTFLEALETQCSVLEHFGLQNAPHTFRHGITFLGALILLMLNHTHLSIIFILAITGCLWPLKCLLQRSKRTQELLGQQTASFRSSMTELFQDMITLHTCGMQSREIHNLHHKTEHIQQQIDAYTHLKARLLALIIFSVGTVIVLMTGWSLWQTRQHHLSFAQTFEFILYAALLTSSLHSLGEAAPQIQKALLSLKDIQQGLQPSREPSWLTGSPAHQTIKLDCLTYHPASSEHPILNTLSLEIPLKSKVGIVGPSGSGKSTLLSLMAGLLPPTQGSIQIGGMDIYRLSPEERSRAIGLAPQEISLRTRSLKEHLLYPAAQGTALPPDLLASLDLASWVDSLPQGLETPLGPQGIMPSIGQKQRIALARLCLQDPCVYLLDEATTGLDPLSEARTLKVLHRYTQDRTCIMVSHKLSLIQEMDLILFLYKGRLTGMGSHTQLMKEHILYQSFVSLYGLNDHE